MVKVFVIYDTKYGNTKLVAEKIAEGMEGVEGIETTISDVEEVDPEKACMHACFHNHKMEKSMVPININITLMRRSIRSIPIYPGE